MKCSKAHKLLPLYAGGDLPGHQAAALDEHLRTCPDCQQEAEAYRVCVGAVRRARADAPPEGDWVSCWAGVAGALQHRPKPRRLVPWPTARVLWPAFRTAAVWVLALGLGMAIGWRMKPAAPPQVAREDTAVAEEQALAAQGKTRDDKGPVQDKPGPARRLFVMDELTRPGAPFNRGLPPAQKLAQPAGGLRSRRGYYMDNIQLIGVDRQRR